MKKILRLLPLYFLFLIPDAFCQIKLPAMVSDGMVLQRDADVKIWGWASPGEMITVHFQDISEQSSAGPAGMWEVSLSGLETGGPHIMQISGSDTVTVQNILVGDVWVASGQSNMELPMHMVRPLYAEEIATADFQDIRFFNAPQQYDFKNVHHDYGSGEWQTTSPQSVRNFPAAAWFFARSLYDVYNVPVGILHSSLGGSPAQSWMSEESLRKFPAYYDELQKFKDDDLIERIEREDRTRIDAWYSESLEKDKGYANPDKPWHHPGTDFSDWDTMTIPGYWADTGMGIVNGVMWFQKEIELPAGSAGKPADLELGSIVDADSVFVNGRFVGNTTYMYPPRWYRIPEGILLDGKNTIVIRVINERGRGGFIPDKPYELVVSGDTLDLRGEWRYRTGAVMEPLAGQTFIRWKPGGLYNAMLAPLFNYRIKGVIWYQGESNTGNPGEYRELFPALIRDWRASWVQDDLPFIYVQLANYMKPSDEPSESNWAMLREAQLKTLSVPNTAMAVTIDIGEWNDIHPLNKKDVGTRLALAARKVAYGEKDIVYSGPVHKSMKVVGNEIHLTFMHTGGGLYAKGGELREFAIAGEDGIFKHAKAEIRGDTIAVWNDKVTDPVAVRYAWADNPEGANLYNREGLPASPFRTDR